MVKGREAGNAAISADTVAGVKRRRRSKLERRRIVEETLLPGASVARVARAHGVNANQVFLWRRLYQQGSLEVGTEETGLVPVRLFHPEQSMVPTPAATGAPVRPRSSVRAAAPGTIHIECGRARLHIEGAADPLSLRVVLECLLG
jgi:transposase